MSGNRSSSYEMSCWLVLIWRMWGVCLFLDSNLIVQYNYNSILFWLRLFRLLVSLGAWDIRRWWSLQEVHSSAGSEVHKTVLNVQIYSVRLRAEIGWRLSVHSDVHWCSRRGLFYFFTVKLANICVCIYITSKFIKCIMIYHYQMSSLKKAVSERSVFLPYLSFGLDRSQKMRDPHMCPEGSQHIQASRCILHLPEVRSWDSWKTLFTLFLVPVDAAL